MTVREAIARVIHGHRGSDVPYWAEWTADAVIAALETPEAVERVAEALPRTMMDAHDRDKYARAAVRALLHGGDVDGDE